VASDSTATLVVSESTATVVASESPVAVFGRLFRTWMSLRWRRGV
jgi:hypothetical protein